MTAEMISGLTLKTEHFRFDIVDFAVFGAMLLLSALTGLYYGCRSRYCKSGETPTLREYLTGSGNMKSFPVAMSLVARCLVCSYLVEEFQKGLIHMNLPYAGTIVWMQLGHVYRTIRHYISGVTILGTPAEIYNFGTQYWIIVVPICLSGLMVAFVYLPVFCKLQVHSSYEYLELRFNRYVRTLASVLFVLDEVMFLPILIYVPSLAFNQVTGIDIHLIGTIVCVVCIFYTVLILVSGIVQSLGLAACRSLSTIGGDILRGGLKAVVWTDTWQILVMFISVIVVVILGVIAVGGFSVIWERSLIGGRINFFNFNPSMYERHTVFSVIIGGFFYWTSFNAVNQTMVQRYLSLPSVRKSQASVAIFTVGVAIFVSVCCFTGLIIYATYFDCDPLMAGRTRADDQLLPLFVMETVGHLRGVPGLFIAGVFGAALSSLSVVLNSTSTVVLEDFAKGCMRMKLRESTATLFVKIVALILGAVAVGFIFIVEHMGGVLAMATSLSAIAAGTTFGIFTLGMLIPWSNSIGAITGAIAGALMSGWVSFGSQYAGAAGLVVSHKLPGSVDGCDASYAVNYTVPEYPNESEVFTIFRLSYHWITPIGVTTVLVVGSLVSLMTGKTDIRYMDPDLISPVLHRLLPKEAFRYEGYALRNARHREENDCNDVFTNKIRLASFDMKEDSHRSLASSEER